MVDEAEFSSLVKQVAQQQKAFLREKRLMRKSLDICLYNDKELLHLIQDLDSYVKKSNKK